MALPNPTINPPRLASDQSFLHSRSPSHSPPRSRARDVDPLLRDLSPGKTLRAFTSQDRTRNDALAKSIGEASHSQRTLGIKVAQACKDLKAWVRELEGWQWPGTFDTPEPARKKQRMSTLTMLSYTSYTSAETSTEREEEFWGSLSSHTVRAYEKRVEEICVAFDAIDLEELKSFVLSAHSRAGKADASIDDSIGAIGAATDLKRLDDFTALITATILQALPYLPRLTRLLDTWTIRLSILRSTPAYLRDLQQARTDLDHGWAALAVSPSISQANFTGDNLEEMKNVISTQVYSLGKRLDRFLDMLEGRHEVVPDAWIDDFEDLEQEYGEWVVKAERKVLEGEWKAMKAQVKDTVLKLAKENEEGELEDQHEDRDLDEAVDEEVIPVRNLRPPREPKYETTTIVGPTVTSTVMSRGSGSIRTNSSTHTASTGPITHTTSTGPITTTMSTRSAGTTRSNTSTYTSTTGPITTTVSSRGRGNTSANTSTYTTTSGPSSTTVTTVITGGRNGRPVTTTSVSNTDVNRSTSSPIRMENPAAPTQGRHVPIVLDYTNLEHPFDPNSADATSTADGDANHSRAQSKTPSESTNGLSVKKRAAFLNSDIERSDSLIKTRSAPIVRPFEHASNAFTRLFKREGHSEEDRSGQQTRSVTEGSKRNVEKASDGGSGRSSQMSGGAVGSIKTTASSNKNRNMVYGDLAQMPERPRAVEKPRGRDRTEKGDVGSKMQYADLPVGIVSEPRVKEMPSKDTMSKKSRKSGDSKRSRAGTLEKDAKRMVSADLVSATGSLRESEDSKRPKAKEMRRPESYEATSVNERPANDDSRRSRPNTPKDTKKESADGVDVNKSGSFDEMSRPARPKTSNRHQSQDLTALPDHHPEELRAISENVVPATYKPESRSAPQAPKPKMVAAPETYRPSGLSSPFRSRFDPEQERVPVDWPLSASATPDEHGSPSKGYFSRPTIPPRSKSAQDHRRSARPLESHDFEEFFVMTVPDRSANASTSSSYQVAGRDFGPISPIARPRSAPGHKRSKSGDGSSLKSARGGRSRRNEFPDAKLPRPVSVVEEEDFVDVIDAEEHGENAAAYFGSQGSPRTKPKPPVSPGVLKLNTPDTVPEAPDEPGIVRRASAASIEAYSPSKLKSVEISRSASLSEIRRSPRSEPQTPKARNSAEVEEGSPLNYNGMMVFPSPPSVPPRRSSVKSNSSSAKSESILQRWSASSSLPEDAEPDAPLNAKIAKQRRGKENARGDGKNVLSSVNTSPMEPGQDNFDRHVSEVLDRVHAPIRFKTRPGAQTPVTSSGVEQKLKARAERQGKNMTLAPAESSPKKASASDPEVKLYHLTQVGRAEPIKLYVRLVGEGERVMVRVGGGWADLGDYLRQYAEHHGSRTVSEGKLELQTATSIGSREINGTGKRTFSGPAVVPEPKSRTPITPTGGKVPFEKPSIDSMRADPWGKRPSRPRLWLGDSDDEEQSAVQTYLEETPKSVASRPSSADVFGRPDSRQSVQDSSSPSGPGLDGKRRGELPEQKARWVEGMIEKAMKSASAASGAASGAANASMTASAEKTREEKAFADMGKVGGTRRVVFRSASGTEAAK